jgi:ribosomal protein S12 methylthiotransferase
MINTVNSLSDRKVYIVSLGCSKNRVDTEIMLGRLIRAGYLITGTLNQADAVIVNTCGFLQESVNEALSELTALAGHKNKTGFRLVATGCLVQRMGKELLHKVPEIDALVGVHGYNDIVSAVTGGRKTAVPKTACEYPSAFYHNRVMTTGPGWAYLRIADGCDNNCSYCLIPKIRGRFRSRKMGDIVAEARMLVSKGVKEINLIAQDTTNYGLDLHGKRCLGKLVKRLDKVPGLEWIRILYAHPAHLDEGLINDLSETEHAVNYLDLPLQHASDRILASMGRRTTKKSITSLIKKLRKESPGLVLRTTMMVGYPGETEKEFRELMDLAVGSGFDRLGAFVFSPEPGTRAAGLPGQVDAGTKDRRLRRLMEQQQKISLSRNRIRLNKKVMVLVEGECVNDLNIKFRKGFRYYGRSRAEAPEVDGKVYIKTGKRLEYGSIVPVRIDRAWDYDLGGTLINQQDWALC